MTTANTDLQQQEQAQQAQAGIQAVQTIPLTQNHGSNVPAVYTANYAQQELDKFPKITPPSVDNIHKNMWISSGMVGLMAALATGNAAGGIVAGMWAAVAVHDGGYSLRERGKYTRQLQEDGYSYPAILKWYKTGDNKDLETEHGQMEQDKRQDNQQLNENARFNAGQQNSATQAELNRSQQWSIANQAHLDRIAATTAAGDAATRADRKADQADQRASNSEVAKQIAPQQAKLSMLHAAAADLENLDSALKKGNKEEAEMAYNSYIEHKAKGIQGGNASMTREEMERQTGLPDWKDSELQKWHLLGSGTPTETWLKAQKAGTTNDLSVETTVLQDGAIEHYYSLMAGGATPQQASDQTNKSYSGTGLHGVDYTKLPAGGVTEQPAGQATTTQPAPTAQQVDDVMAKYGHQKK